MKHLGDAGVTARIEVRDGYCWLHYPGGFTPGRCVPIAMRRGAGASASACASSPAEGSGTLVICRAGPVRGVRETGLEPARYYYHQALNLARLPIPPFPRRYDTPKSRWSPNAFSARRAGSQATDVVSGFLAARAGESRRAA